MTWLQWCTFGFLNLNFAVFIVAARLLFRADYASLKAYAFMVAFLALTSASVVSLYMSPSEHWAALGGAVALMAISALLFGAAVQATREKPFTVIFSPDEPEQLNTRGPYAYIRHPFYSAYLLNFIAAAVASNTWVPWMVFLVILWIYYVGARSEELKFLGSPFATRYARYRATTGMFVPKWRGRALP